MIKKKANAKHMKNGNHAAPKTGKAAGSTRPLNVNQTYNAKKGKAQSSKHSKPQAGQTKQMKPTPQYDLNDQELIKKAYATIGQHAPKKSRSTKRRLLLSRADHVAFYWSLSTLLAHCFSRITFSPIRSWVRRIFPCNQAMNLLKTFAKKHSTTSSISRVLISNLT